MPRATKLGRSAFLGIPYGKKFDQVKLPKLYMIPPNRISWYIATLMRSVPGTGLLVLLNREYFWAQYIMKRPAKAKNEMMGCRETKKQVNRNKFTK